MIQLFNPGNIAAAPGALSLVERGVNLFDYLMRHLAGDWGDLCSEDQQENDFSLKHGFRLLSAYDTPAGRLWIITEADRSVTTFLLPEEY
jgi:hypothetical protein